MREIGFEWGPVGAAASGAGHVVVVDVLRFTTAVTAAAGRGARVFPYRWKDPSAAEYARSVGGKLVESLSPVDMLGLAPGDRVVLPSPNGSTCAALAAEAGATVVAACLRNASAVARWLDGRAGRVTMVACGERWPDGSLRPALEDLLGAGAVLAGLRAERSPEADAAVAAWRDAAPRIAEVLEGCLSGQEQLERGWERDLRYASVVDADETVPVLVDGSFTDALR